MSEKKEVKFRASKVMFFDLESTSLDLKLGSIIVRRGDCLL